MSQVHCWQNSICDKWYFYSTLCQCIQVVQTVWLKLKINIFLKRNLSVCFPEKAQWGKVWPNVPPNILSWDTFRSRFLFNLNKINKGKLSLCVWESERDRQRERDWERKRGRKALLPKTMVEFHSGHMTASWHSAWSVFKSSGRWLWRCGLGHQLRQISFSFRNARLQTLMKPKQCKINKVSTFFTAFHKRI